MSGPPFPDQEFEGSAMGFAEGLRLLFEATPDGIVIQDAEGTILTGNPAAERILGLSLEQLKGRSSVDTRWRAIREDGSPFPGEAHPAMEALRSGKPVEEVVLGVLNPVDGSTHWLQVSAIPMFRDGEDRPYRVMVTFKDFTDRKKAGDELRDSQARLQRAESVAHFGNWELDLRHGTMRASAGAPPIYGLSGEEWSLAEVRRIPLPEYRPVLNEALVRLVERGEPYDVEFRIRRPNDGEERVIHSTAVFDAVRRTVFGVIHDITDLKRAEAERRALEVQVQHLQRMDSIGRLAGGVAHDMNNVLSAILSLAEVQELKAPEDSALRASMATIAKACVRGRTVLRGLLDFAREDLADERILDLNALAREEMALLERTTLRRVRLEMDLQEGLRSVKGDPAALSHVLMNLCLNAVDAMPEGGTLTLRTRNEGPAQVLLEVADNGCGMSPEVLEKALEPFFTTKAQGQGTGLGLSIVYGAVKAHHGTLDIRSAPGAGTTVAIRLPAIEEAPSGTREPERASTPGRALRLLVVDDDELVQQSTGWILESLGHVPTIVASGEAALARLESGEPFDGVLLDMNMPGLGGAGTLPRIRALRPALPVLLATGRADQQAIGLVQGTPFVKLMAKPFTLKDLKAQLEPLGRVGPALS